MKFKSREVFEMWKLFDCVSIGASLDGSYARGEYIRKGQDWKQTVENRERMLEVCPKVDFYISSTVSIFNAFHIADFHKEWVELGLIEPKDFNINICQSPEWYRADVFPKWFKEEKIIPAYEEHIAWLTPQDSLRRATTGYQSMLSLIKERDATEHWPRFLEETAKLDNLRGEDFFATFPEFKELK